MELILPGALWPNPNATAFAPIESHPTLARWLGKSVRTPHARSYQEIVADRIGVPAHTTAELRWRGEALDRARTIAPFSADSGTIHCADPLHLYLARDHLVVTELGETAPHREEAEQLAAELTALIRTEWPQAALRVATPTRWYLTGIPSDACANTTFTPLAEASSRPYAEVLPHGAHARAWLRRMNEWQVFLANHPINRAREQQGLPPINALWLWGNHPVTSPNSAKPRSQPLHVFVNDDADPILLGWLAAQRIPFTCHRSWPTASTHRPDLVILDTLAEAARRLDWHTWQHALSDLETHWFSRFPRPPRVIHLAATRAAITATPVWWRWFAKPVSLERFNR